MRVNFGLVCDQHGYVSWWSHPVWSKRRYVLAKCGVMLRCVVLHHSVTLTACVICLLPAFLCMCKIGVWSLLIFTDECWKVMKECRAQTHTERLIWPARNLVIKHRTWETKWQRSLGKRDSLVFLAHLIIDIVQWQNIFHACQQYDTRIDRCILI